MSRNVALGGLVTNRSCSSYKHGSLCIGGEHLIMLRNVARSLCIGGVQLIMLRNVA